jgi:spermidine synthase
VSVKSSSSTTNDDEKVIEKSSAASEKKSNDVDPGHMSILTQYATRYNFVRVLEVSRRADSVLAGSRVLLLDKPGNVHSIYQKWRVLTDSYYDIMTTIPAVIPEGPVGILGLGAGTVARLISHFWPEIDMYGWELDVGVVQVARKYFDLEEIELKEPTDANDNHRELG